LLVLGYRVWPGIFLGAFCLSLIDASNTMTLLGIAAGNTLEGLAGAWLTNRFARGCKFFERPLDVLKFAGLVAVVSLISPPIGAISLSLGNLAFWTREISTSFIWWLADMLSVLVMTPLLVVWGTDFRIRWNRGQAFEFALLTVSLVLATEAVFGQLAPDSAQGYLLPYLCLPFLIWAAFRFGPRETTIVIFVLAAIALWGTLRGYGLFARTVPEKALLSYQGFIIFNSVVALCVAAVVAQRRRAEEAHRQVLRRLEGAEETERGRISRELHDRLGQDLTALKLGLQLVKKQGPFTPSVQASIGQLEKLADSLMQDIHRLAWELRPAALDDFGLDMALRRYATEWSEHNGVAADFHSRGMETHRLPTELETTLYRITQEALTNVLRHAKAQRVSVLLERRPDHVLLIVEDDGQGFDAQTALKAPGAHSRLGLLGMQERVILANGTFEIESTAGAGTTVFVRIPLESKIPAVN
jgi:signal transduction histidine kinase